MTTEFDNDPVAVYLRHLATVPPLTKSEEANLLQQIQTHRQPLESATKRLIEAYLPMVVSVAGRYLSSGLSKLDLYQEGNIGLMRAIDTFSGPSEAFAAHAASNIEQAIIRAIDDAQNV
jgi:DNA-directed RNA polymerase sigma subunit (sigma70/sigma32)